MTIEIRRLVMQVMTDRSLVRWMTMAAALAATVVLTAPIGGGSGV